MENLPITIGLAGVLAAAIASAVYVTVYIHRAIAGVKDELADYKVHVAETYMSKSGGTQAIDRVGAAVRDLRADLAGRMERLENVILKNGRGH